MKPIIGFAGNGHLMENSFAAAKIKGFECEKYIPAATSFHPEDLRRCDIVYICPDRPSNVDPKNLVDLVLPHLDRDAVLVIHCQVEPGFTRKVKWPEVYYHVETLKVSEDTMDRALNPERIILGCKHAMKVGYLVREMLAEYLDCFNCPIHTMSYESAELAKIAINLYLAAQIDTTATLVKVAESVGANWNDIIPTLQTDKRIGQYAYLKPGNGYGPHIQRDVDWLAEYQHTLKDSPVLS